MLQLFLSINIPEAFFDREVPYGGKANKSPARRILDAERNMPYLF